MKRSKKDIQLAENKGLTNGVYIPTNTKMIAPGSHGLMKTVAEVGTEILVFPNTIKTLPADDIYPEFRYIHYVHNGKVGREDPAKFNL